MKKVDEKNLEEKSGMKGATQSQTVQASANGMSSEREDVITDKAAAPDAPASKQPTKTRERNENWDDLGDEAPGSRIRLY